MKTRFFALSLLCAAGFAQADGMPDATPSAAAEYAAAPMQARTRSGSPQHKFKRLPHGDLRHCLDLGSNQAVIRCAEKQRRR